MNVLRTGMNISISHIHVWLCNISPKLNLLARLVYFEAALPSALFTVSGVYRS